MANFTGTSGNDTINGTNSADTINGLGGDDTLYGNGGNDRIDGGTGADNMYGGTGNDIFTVDDTGDVVNENSGEGTDQVKTSLTSYTLGANVEKLLFTTTAAVIGIGNAENNEIMTAGGNTAADSLYGYDGWDTLWGGGGNDSLYGGNGGDMLIGEAGADYMEGNAGDDAYIVDNVGDTVFEQANEGLDYVYSGLNAYTLPAEVEDLSYNNWTGNFAGTGNELDNRIWGGSGADTLSGLEGNDELTGGTGVDTLDGGDGVDLLIGGGGTGADILTGGSASDTFKIGYYESGTGSAADRITDFESGVDLIDVSGWDADINQPDNQDFFFIDDAPFDGTAGQLRAEFDGFNTWVQGDIDGDTVADFEIRVDGFVMLGSWDFVL